VHFLLIALLQSYPYPTLAEYQSKVYLSLIFPLLLKPAAQIMEMVWIFSMKNSRLVLPRLHTPVIYILMLFLMVFM
jgi:hypothetical protein